MSVSRLALEKFRGITERGIHACYAFQVDFGAGHVAETVIIDTAEVGAMSIAFFINNLSNVTMPCVLAVSQDGVTWTNIAHKDLAGSETAAGSFNITTTQTKHLIVTYSDYPQVVGARFFRVTIDPASAPNIPILVYATLK